MKRIHFYLLIVFLAACGNFQSQKNAPVFHRLLITNADNELMVVKLENRDFWVTPGIYLTSEQPVQHNLDSIASTFGVALKDTKLKGTFLLKRDINGKQSESLRNVYLTEAVSFTEKSPKESKSSNGFL